ncbi:MAG TPA: VOC family protein [Gemmatimonadales bacterium]|nr:VOC family protein [Gemmatimonadales bacterium]
MGAGSRDIFDGTGEPATPGSYGEPPRGYRLPEATRLGPVRLQVADLARSLAYYHDILGLDVQAEDAARAVLGAHGDTRSLVELHANPAARAMRPRARLGLYHFALLLPDRASLGRFVGHAAARDVRLGAGDHLVSEAFYLTDPDGLGIEVYADRPRDRWRRLGRELMLATDPVDVDGVLAAAGDTTWTGMPAGSVIGHVHLHVGDLAAAAAFYSDGLGLDRITWRYPGALFLGAGGYHHHLGANTWAGPLARPPTPDDAHLLEWTVEVPSRTDVDEVERSWMGSGHAVAREAPESVVGRDPWGTAVRVVARAPS